MDLTRREFLKLLGSAALVTSISVIPGCSILSDLSMKKDDILGLEQEIEWSFLGVKIDKDASDPEFIRDNLIELGVPEVVSPNSEYYKRMIGGLEEHIIREAESRGHSQNNLAYAVIRRHFASQEKFSAAESLKKYVQIATNFLETEIKGIYMPKIEWAILLKGDNYSEQLSNKGLIGKTLYTDTEILISDNRSYEGLFNLVIIDANNGGKVILDKGGHIEFIYLSVNSNAITTPFSELIPVSLINERNEYVKEAGEYTANQSLEALSEAISVELGLKMSDRLNIPDGRQLVERGYLAQFEKNPELYLFVPLARQYVQQHGVQAAFDMYRSSPSKFMSAIGAIQR